MNFEKIPEKYYKKEKTQDYFDENVKHETRLARYNYQQGFKDGFKYAHDFITEVLTIIMSNRFPDKNIDCQYDYQVYTYHPLRLKEIAEKYYENKENISAIEYDYYIQCVCKFLDMPLPECKTEPKY